MPSGCIGLEWCAERLTEVQAGRLASGMPNKASLYVDALDTVAALVELEELGSAARLGTHGQPWPQRLIRKALFLGRKLLRESHLEVVPFVLLPAHK